ncbi:uncharacterized protein LOC121726518 isoform X2 [Aricia agestis]|uniref:uncharacterized protein LOC121726518 isoform X2 n=1 Tax=Aricia agestis TaxID=91739 RepID=UPI001C206090|nr:uncharacterized protein LOC121726518 isoform X2 [Aricia agestis]
MYIAQIFQPERSEFYDPNWGYEPYWIHGDYYFNITNTTIIDPRLNISTICGGPCPYIFTIYGVICARNNNMTHRTFKNYCELVDIDCNNRMKWTIIYRGECHEALKPYPLWLANAEADIPKRAVQYVEDFEKAYPKTSTLSVLQQEMMERGKQ